MTGNKIIVGIEKAEQINALLDPLEEMVTCEGCNENIPINEAYCAEDGFWVCSKCLNGKEYRTQLKVVLK